MTTTTARTHTADCTCPPCLMADMTTHLRRTAGSQAAAADRVHRITHPAPAATGAPKATDRQVAFAVSLATRKGLAVTEDDFRAMTKTAISPVIDRMLTLPDAPKTTPTPAASSSWAEWRRLAAELANLGGRHGARFAVDTETGTANDLAFWWIVPGTGQWEGRYFLRQIIGGQPPVRVRMTVDAMLTIARKIHAAGAYQAMLRYGRKIGACGHCGTVLTNQDSRTKGIGPVCERKH